MCDVVKKKKSDSLRTAPGNVNMVYMYGKINTRLSPNSMNLAHSSIWFPVPAYGSQRLHSQKDVADKIIGQFSLIVCVINADSGFTQTDCM